MYGNFYILGTFFFIIIIPSHLEWYIYHRVHLFVYGSQKDLWSPK